MTAPLGRRLLAELLGSAFLAAVVIGSGIAAQRLSPGDVGLAAVRERGRDRRGPVHDHPDVRTGLGRALQPGRVARRRRFGGLSWRDALAYTPVQIAGGAVAIATIRVLYPDVTPAEAADVVLPHPDGRDPAAPAR